MFFHNIPYNKWTFKMQDKSRHVIASTSRAQPHGASKKQLVL